MKSFHNGLKLSFFLGLMMLVYQPQLRAQEYIPIAKQGAHWVIAQNYEDAMGIEYLWEYYMDGDTLLNSTLYKKVYRRALVPTMAQPPFTAQEAYYLFGLIRDMPVERKVYAISLQMAGECPLGEEFLMYDFSLDIGDLIDFCLYVGYAKDAIESISSDTRFGVATMVYLSNTFHSYFEGLGSSNGLFEEIFTPMKSTDSPQVPYLYYYCLDNENCDLFVNIPNLFSSSKELNIYPNPACNFIVFEWPQNTEKVMIKIYDVYGKIVKELRSNTDKVQWDFPEINSGVYFYTTEIQGLSYIGRFLVK
ncbi:MAG: hypothetical protein B7C24_00820 [Bacteroidetes bacterium 4572_77]|nr:MAG: hypothetical protein B7C24_00820 [Bacteroidetes bacterium 4572_77]